MATLHVRNVPDELYELLRDEAERDGRSIGAQAVILLRRALIDRSELVGSVRRAVSQRRSPFLSRFAESAKEVVVRAQGHAQELGSPEVTPGHVMLAMLEDGVLRRALERAGVTEAEVRATLPRGEAPTGPAPFSADTKRLLERALRVSLAAKQDLIAPEHLLFAVERQFDVRVAHADEPPLDAYRAVTLEGDWTAQLNELAAEGWELFSVTPVGSEVRVILRRA
jgi:plasmid stability protein